MNIAKDKEINLINKLKKGNKSAFDEIFSAYWRDFYSFAVKATGSPAEAEDLVQDIFVDIWVRREHININLSLKAYIFSSIKNKLLDKIRREKRFEYYADLILKYTFSECELNPEQEFILNEKLQFLKDKINSLPEKCREIFVLHKMEDYSITEISEKLHISPQTVKNQLTKASGYLKLYRQQILTGSLSILWLITIH